MDREQLEFENQVKAFRAKYPGYKEAEPIECLNLIMRKGFAKQILSGEKKVEFRAYSEHYFKRLYDKDVLKFMKLHKNDEEALDFCDPLRVVKKIHFHDYNNSWFLDVECVGNDVVSVTDEDVKFLREGFGCTELDEQLSHLQATCEENRPMYFYFVIGQVIETNLH